MKKAKVFLLQRRNGATWIDSTNKSFSDWKSIVIMISTPLVVVNSTSDIVFSGSVRRTFASEKSRHYQLLRTRFLDPTKTHKNRTDSVVVCGFLAPFFGE